MRQRIFSYFERKILIMCQYFLHVTWIFIELNWRDNLGKFVECGTTSINLKYSDTKMILFKNNCSILWSLFIFETIITNCHKIIITERKANKKLYHLSNITLLFISYHWLSRLKHQSLFLSRRTKYFSSSNLLKEKIL